MPIILALKRQRQENCCNFETRLSSIVSLGPVKTVQQDSVSSNKPFARNPYFRASG